MIPATTSIGRRPIMRCLVACCICIFVSLGQLPQAGADDRSIAPDQLEFFEKNIRPILIARCYECHANAEAQGGLRLDSRDAVLRGGDSGTVVLAGNSDESLLIKAVRYRSQELQMPPKGALPPSEIALLEQWVLMGAPDPRRAAIADSAAISPTGMSVEEGRQFWSLRPITNPETPAPKNQNWSRTAIDSFVLSKLDAENLSPAPEANRRTLARRVSLDLTGLPLTTEELNAFLADDRPDAYDHFVDALLASPQYGVRWGRHWLDVARYADSNGLDENIAFGNAWRYRDYVIHSMNCDKPIDTFFVEQIAGDLIPNKTQESHMATGYLVLGAKVLAEPDREKLNMDTIDEQLDAIGKTFLGMTFGCVRCHDHKFDPIKQKDYYALAAIFKSTKTFGDSNFGAIKHWNEISIATELEKESLKKVTSEIAKRQSAVSSFRNQSMEHLRQKVRGQAAIYLQAAASVRLNMTLQEIETIAKPLNLHPRVLFHCRRHLAFHPDAPLFAKWHELFESQLHEAIGKHYSELFDRSDRAWADAKQKDTHTKKLEDPELELARTERIDLNGFLAIPPKPEFAFDAQTLQELYRLAEEARVYESFAADEPSFMGVTDGVLHSSLALHIRGSHRNLGEPIARDLPQVLRPDEEAMIFSRKQSGRLELARWMTSPSNPLTARVFVNRVWRWHFGQALVTTTENFGKLGDRPSHPDLLDYLARMFIESGWSLKELQRTIVKSSTYRMRTQHLNSARAMAIDPENRLLWRIAPRRMEAEQIRDCVLFVAGQLDLQMDGKSVPLRNRQFVFDHTSIDHTRYESLRRAVYLPVIRNHLYSLFDQFDFPDPTMPTGNRTSTTVAPQALLLMNSDWVMKAADRIIELCSKETMTVATRIERIYRQVLNRDPSSQELERAMQFVSEASLPVHLARGTASESEVHIGDSWILWKLFAQSLLVSNEFVFIQ